jgi:Na+-translocating ferredoxin:NAD+ oxidoreductase RnfC subunit
LEEYNRSKEVTPATEYRSTCAGYGKKIHTHAKYNPSNVHTTEILDTLKQKLLAKSQRLRRYKEANERKQQNRLFTTNEKTYCRNLKSEGRLDCQDKLPDKQMVTNFWASI